MAQIIPFSSRIRVAPTGKPPSGRSAEILRTIGGGREHAGDQVHYVETKRKGPGGWETINVEGPFTADDALRYRERKQTTNPNLKFYIMPIE